jgi:hypothetical protein
MDKLQLTGQNLGRVFNFRRGHLHAPTFLVLSVLAVENSAQTTSRFSPVSYRTPRENLNVFLSMLCSALYLLYNLCLEYMHAKIGVENFVLLAIVSFCQRWTC